MTWRYDAFISYKRESELEVAKAIEHGLHRLAKPWRRRRTVDVFRDTSKLAGGDDLDGELRAALDGSETFVLLASPAAARSKWVDNEVAHWVTTRGSKNLIVVLCDGQLRWDGDTQALDPSVEHNAAPSALVEHLKTEPAYIDLSWTAAAFGRRRMTLDDPTFRSGVAQIQAAIRHLPVDEVYAEDLKEFKASRRRRTMVITMLIILALGLAGLAAVANRAREDADDRAREATARLSAVQAQANLENDPVEAGRQALLAYEGEPSSEHLALLGSVLRSGLAAEADLSALDVVAADIDGANLVVGTRGGSLVMVDRDGLATLTGESDDPVRRVALLANRVIVARESNILEVIDVGSASMSASPLVELAGMVRALEQLPGQTALVAGLIDGRLMLVDPGSAQPPRALPTSHGGPVLTLDSSTDGTRLIAASRDAVTEWSTDTWELIGEAVLPPNDPGDPVWSAAVAHPEGGLLAITDVGSVAVVGGPSEQPSNFPSREDGQTVAVGVRGRNRAAALGQDALIFTTSDQQVVVQGLDGSVPRRPIPLGDGVATAVGYDPLDDVVIVVTTEEARWWTWDDAGSTERVIIDDNPTRSLTAGLEQHAAGSEAGSLVQYDPSGTIIGRANIGGPVRGLANVGDDGALLATMQDGDLWTWGSPDDEPRLLARLGDEIRNLAIAPNGGEWAVAGASGSIYRLDTSGNEISRIDAHDTLVRSLAYSPDGSLLMSSGSDGAIRVWDLAAATAVDEYGTPDSSQVLSASPNYDMTRIAFGTDAGDVMMWEIATDQVHQLGGHQGWARAVVWGPDQHVVVSGGTDGVIAFYDPISLRPLGPSIASGSGVEALAITQDGTQLHSAHLDGEVRVWNIDQEGWIASVCELVSGPELVDTIASRLC